MNMQMSWGSAFWLTTLHFSLPFCHIESHHHFCHHNIPSTYYSLSSQSEILLYTTVWHNSFSKITGTFIFVQIVIPHFVHVQFECYRIPRISCFVLTQIEYIQFVFLLCSTDAHFICIEIEVLQIEYFEHGLQHHYWWDN